MTLIYGLINRSYLLTFKHTDTLKTVPAFAIVAIGKFTVLRALYMLSPEPLFGLLTYTPLPYGDRAFPVTAVRIWNSLLQHITSAPSLPIFCSRLKTYFFELCYP